MKNRKNFGSQEEFVKKKGFTLVELLVVISIIALLMAILVPSLRRAKAQAQRIVCANHQRSIAIAMTAYGSDNNGNVPISCIHTQVYARFPIIWDNEELVQVMQPYWGDNNVVSCPAAKHTIKYNDDPMSFSPNHWSSPFVWLPGLDKISGSAEWFDKVCSAAPSRKITSASPSKIVIVDLNIVWRPSPSPNWGVQSNHAFGGRVVYCEFREVAHIFTGSNRAYVDTHVEWVTPRNMGRNNGPVTDDP